MGYFVEPTLIETIDSGYRLLGEEIIGPVVTAFAYEDSKWSDLTSKHAYLAVHVGELTLDPELHHPRPARNAPARGPSAEANDIHGSLIVGTRSTV